MTDAKPLQVTPANQWRKTILAELPSGAVAELQRVSAIQTVTQDGSIPDDLYNYMLKAADGSLSESDVTENPQAIQAFFLMQQQVVKAAFVNPRVLDQGADYDKGEINLNDVMDEDLTFVAQWAMRGGDEKDALKRFRQQQARIVAAAQKMPELRPESKR